MFILSSVFNNQLRANISQYNVHSNQAYFPVFHHGSKNTGIQKYNHIFKAFSVRLESLFPVMLFLIEQ